MQKILQSIGLSPDESRLVTRRFAPRELFKLPAQIIIYANKVAITGLKKTFVSTLIQNQNISDTFNAMFEYMWSKSESPVFSLSRLII